MPSADVDPISSNGASGIAEPTGTPATRGNRLIRPVQLRKRSIPDGRMTVVEHLEELRTRLMISLVAVAVGATICFIFAPNIISFLIQFYKDSVPDVPTS